MDAKEYEKLNGSAKKQEDWMNAKWRPDGPAWGTVQDVAILQHSNWLTVWLFGAIIYIY